MSLLSLPFFSLHRSHEPAQAVETLLARMRQRLYPETLPVLASCWLSTLSSAGHNRAWWLGAQSSVKEALHGDALDAFSRDVLLSVRNWIDANVLRTHQLPSGRRMEPPFRSISVERLVPYACRLLNEWLPAEVAYLLTSEDGIPELAALRALDRLLVRERLSPETLEAMIAPGFLSPKLVYPADLEILRDVALARLGRLSAPAPAILPATLLGMVADASLPADYEQRVRAASLVQSEEGEELRVPIAGADAVEILRANSTRIGSVVVTMDGRSWHAARLHAGEQTMIVYTAGERLRIDFSAEHAKLTVRWPEALPRGSGSVPVIGPFEVFGREWRMASWEMNGEGTLLHFTFSRALRVAETVQAAARSHRLAPAYVDMAWSEVERALADAIARNSAAPLEQMHRAELIPLARALYELSHRRQMETQLGAVRFHLAAAEPVYGRIPWRVVPGPVHKALLGARFGSSQMLSEIFCDLPNALAAAHPPQAA